MRPEVRQPQTLAEEALDRSLRIEEHVGFRPDYLLVVLNELDLVVVKVVPVATRMVPGKGVVVTVLHGAFVVGDGKEIVHGLFFLGRRDVGAHIQVMHGILHKVVEFVKVRVKALETDDEYARQLPDVDLLASRLVRLALLAIPHVFAI